MAEGTKDQGPMNPMNPMDFWKQWGETSTKMWSNVLDGGKGTYVDPYSLYRPWLKSIEVAQEQMKTSSAGAIDAKEAWNQWYEATTGTLAKAAELGGDPLGLTTQWLEMMEENRAKILAGGTIPTDPFTFFKQWYDATNETWSKVVADVIADEKFVENASKFMESYTSYYMATRRANEDYFRNLQLPTRSDLARVAEIIVALEEKVDGLDEGFEVVEEGYSQMATKGAITELEGRLSRVEKKLDALTSMLGKLETVEKLAKQAVGMEKKLDALTSMLGKLEAVEKLAKQAVGMEKKLDKALEVIVKFEAKNSSTANTVDVEATRKTTKKSARNQKANGSNTEVEAK